MRYHHHQNHVLRKGGSWVVKKGGSWDRVEGMDCGKTGYFKPVREFTELSSGHTHRPLSSPSLLALHNVSCSLKSEPCNKILERIALGFN